MRSILILLFILTSGATAQATPLSAAEKANFFTGTNNSCLEAQVKLAANKAMTIGQVQTYCGCYAKAFADFMQAEDLEANKVSLTPATAKKADEVSDKCIASTLKK
jgi:hypothetical protein